VNILIDRTEMILWFIVAILLGMFLAFVVDYYSDFDVQLQVYANYGHLSWTLYIPKNDTICKYEWNKLLLS
jgi:hypothetical protein